MSYIIEDEIIKHVEIKENKLILHFESGRKRLIYDDIKPYDGVRYLSTDDDLSTIVGGKIISINTREGSIDDYFDQHELLFVEIITTKGFLTIVNHNEHDGHYGGFNLQDEWSK